MAHDYFIATTAQHIEDVYTVMEKAFPRCERREKEEFSRLVLENKALHLLCLDDGTHSKGISAFIMVWDVGDFIFIENFAVDKALRGKGLGGALLEIALKRFKKPAVLEVEPPIDEMTKRRVHFYENSGFFISPFDYEMPPLHSDEKPLPLKIMSYPQPLTEDYFKRWKKAFYRVVYDKIIP